MKIGLSSAAYYGQLETDEAAAHIAELPLDTCEVFLETPSEYTTDFTFRMRYNMNNFPVTSVHPLGTQFEPQLFGRAARQSDDAFAMFANVCRAAESLGAAYYIFHGPFGVRGHLSPANIPFLEERFDQMRERAARHHLRVLWESVSWCSVATPEDVRILLKRIPDVEFVLDTKQVHQAGVDPSTCCAPCVGMCATCMCWTGQRMANCVCRGAACLTGSSLRVSCARMASTAR